VEKIDGKQTVKLPQSPSEESQKTNAIREQDILKRNLFNNLYYKLASSIIV